MSEIRHEKHKKLGPLNSTKSHNKINQIGLQSISPSKTVHQISASNFTKPHDKWKNKVIVNISSFDIFYI